jgi:hypothetical protein
MLKLVVIGAWACIVTIASDYAFSHMRAAPASQAAPAPAQSLQSRKTKEINVPRIAGGKITGYVVAEFGYEVDLNALRPARLDPDALVVDEAFRYLYTDSSIDFSNLKPPNLTALTDAIQRKVNARFGAKVIADVTIQELTFLAENQIAKPI